MSTAVVAAGADLTDFEGLTWTLVNEVASTGEFGDLSNLIEASSLSDGRVRRLAGRADAGDFTLTVNFVASDAGQIQLRTAGASANRNKQYGFKVVFNDEPDANDTPSVCYMLGKVTSARFSGLSVDSVVQQQFVIPIQEEPILDVAEAVA
jgi:hypothetical protein